MLPYINSLGGGIDFVPDEGDRCLVMAEAPGSPYEVCIGFKLKMEFNPGKPEALELGGRIPDFERGSIGLRAIAEDGTEARVLCYRGGTLVMGSGRLATTVYSPIDSSIIHLFDNWEMRGPGGHVFWNREKGGTDVSYEAQYRTTTDSGTDDFQVNLKIAQGDTPVEMSIKRGGGDEHPPFTFSVGSDGLVRVTGMVMEFEAEGKISLKAPNIYINNRRIKAGTDAI